MRALLILAVGLVLLGPGLATVAPHRSAADPCDSYGNCVSSGITYTRANPDHSLYPGDQFTIALSITLGSGSAGCGSGCSESWSSSLSGVAWSFDRMEFPGASIWNLDGVHRRRQLDRHLHHQRHRLFPSHNRSVCDRRNNTRPVDCLLDLLCPHFADHDSAGHGDPASAAASGQASQHDRQGDRLCAEEPRWFVLPQRLFLRPVECDLSVL